MSIHVHISGESADEIHRAMKEFLRGADGKTTRAESTLVENGVPVPEAPAAPSAGETPDAEEQTRLKLIEMAKALGVKRVSDNSRTEWLQEKIAEAKAEQQPAETPAADPAASVFDEPAKADPTPEKITSADLMSVLRELSKAGDNGAGSRAMVKLLEDNGAVNAEGQARLNLLNEEKFAEVYKAAVAKTEELNGGTA